MPLPSCCTNPQVGTKVGGMWYKGTIKDFVVAQGQPGDAHYDPWDSIIVQWDLDDGSSQTKVGGQGGDSISRYHEHWCSACCVMNL